MSQQEIFTNNLNYYISLTDKSQREIALELEIQPATFNKWCMGKAVPRLDTLQRLCTYFNILKSQLLEPRTEENNTNKEQLEAIFDSLTPHNQTLLISLALSLKESQNA